MYSWRVPITTFGQLRIVPSANLGGFGANEGEVVIYDWKIFYSLSGFIIWFVLIPAIVILKSNRNSGTLFILIPLAVVKILWWLFMKLAGMNSVDAIEFGLIFDSTVVGVTVLWLLAKSFTRFRGSVRFFLSFGTMLIIAVIGLLSYSIEFSREFAAFITLFVFIALTMLSSIVMSRRLCKGYYRPVCFMLWLALWIIISTVLSMFGFVVVVSIIFSSGPEFSIEAIFMFALAASIFGLFLYLLNLPYMILGFINPFFHERFCACLNLKSMPAVPDSDSNQPDVQS